MLLSKKKNACYNLVGVRGLFGINALDFVIHLIVILIVVFQKMWYWRRSLTYRLLTYQIVMFHYHRNALLCLRPYFLEIRTISVSLFLSVAVSFFFFFFIGTVFEVTLTVNFSILWIIYIDILYMVERGIYLGTL